MPMAKIVVRSGTYASMHRRRSVSSTVPHVSRGRPAPHVANVGLPQCGLRKALSGSAGEAGFQVSGRNIACFAGVPPRHTRQGLAVLEETGLVEGQRFPVIRPFYPPGWPQDPRKRRQ